MAEVNYLELIVKELTKAQKFGFQWPNYSMILKQVESECEEVRMALKNHEPKGRIHEEVGDVFHVLVSLCCFFELEVNQVLRASALKFQK